MFATDFSHYLSFGLQDQQTARQLAGHYEGLIVPGTVASFHRDGTGGFVLSLSALPDSPRYAIDPRFPLFQQQLPKKKSAHGTLAEVLGDETLANTTFEPQPEQFSSGVIESIAEHWADFNRGYQSTSNSKFDKYAERLGEPVREENSEGPAFVLPPYVMCSGVADPWWPVSKDLFAATERHIDGTMSCVRVVAATDVYALGPLLEDIEDSGVVVWVSGLEEAKADQADLVEYARTLRNAAERGRHTFALYGGFFSVLMAAFGLTGAAHGIGFSEHRAWRELPSSGAPPARYYVPGLHRYMQPDEAQILHDSDPELVRCACVECQGLSPLELTYHDLMRHSVRCRAREISDFAQLNVTDMADLLNDQTAEFFERLALAGLPPRFEAKVARHRATLEMWRQVVLNA